MGESKMIVKIDCEYKHTVTEIMRYEHAFEHGHT